MGVGKQLPELSRRISTIPKFWRIERISLNCLTYEADSGDLILFQGNNFSGKLNQLVQASDYGKLSLFGSSNIRSCWDTAQIR
jgi:hypothetical protein